MFTAGHERRVGKMLVDRLDEVAIDGEFMGKHARKTDEIRVLGNALQDFLGGQPMKDVIVVMRDVLFDGLSNRVDQHDFVALLLEKCRHVGQAQRRHRQSRERIAGSACAGESRLLCSSGYPLARRGRAWSIKFSSRKMARQTICGLNYGVGSNPPASWLFFGMPSHTKDP